MTCNEDVGKDVSELFNLLTGYSGQREWRKLFVAPVNLRDNMVKQIQNCIQYHSPEDPSRIRMVMNSLVDPGMIQWLYKASMKGIVVDLVVRGICCLKPGLKGISENITVRSIVGRFLEHPRIYLFRYKGDRHVYLGSADLMQRNLNRRVEILFPVDNLAQREHILHIMTTLLSDNVKARELQADGQWVRVKPGKKEAPLNSQTYFLDLARQRTLMIDTIS
jgi:polyphosphate kinase